jgi:hypothetical protein
MFSPAPRIKTALVTIAFASALVVGLTACGDPVEPLGDGALSLSWQVSPHGCDDAGVDTVEVRIENAHRDRAESFSCIEGEAVIENIAPANYELTLVGLDSDENETFISEARTVTISAEEVTETTLVRLTAKRSSIEVAWRFDNGRVCGANGVSTVSVSLFDENSYEIARKQFSCDKGLGVFGDLAAGDFTVEADAQGDQMSFLGSADVQVGRGDDATVDVELKQQN